MDERVQMRIHIVRTVAAVFPYLCFGKKSIASWTLSGARTCCWKVLTNASWVVQSFSIERKVRTESSRRSDRWCLDSWASDGISRRSDGCKGSDFFDLESVQNLLQTYLWRRLLKLTKPLFKSIIVYVTDWWVSRRFTRPFERYTRDLTSVELLQSLLGGRKFLLDTCDTDLAIIRPFPYQRNKLWIFEDSKLIWHPCEISNNTW
jgi:hypothetical protein